MASELPYFRFTVQEWQNGKISLENYEVKGLFIDLCGYYWIQDCNITLALLQKKFRNDIIILDELIKNNIIKHEKKTDLIQIEFLNKQFDLLSEKRKLRQIAGSMGGKAKAMLQQNPSYKDKDKDKDKDKEKYKEDIDVRKLKFADTITPFLETYGKDLLNEFYKYWTEPNRSNTRFRMELQKTWSLERRLETWARNDKNFNLNKTNVEQPKKRHQPLG